MQEPNPDVWFPGTGSPESVIWATEHGYPYPNLRVIRAQTEWLKEVYIQVAKEAGYTPGPGNFGGNVLVSAPTPMKKPRGLGALTCGTIRTGSRAPRNIMTLPDTGHAPPLM